MGYTSYFNGEITIDPPFDAALAAEINTFHDQDHRPAGGGFGFDGDVDERGVKMPGIWCQWLVEGDGTKIVWDEGEKFYESSEWMAYLIDRWVVPTGRKANGVIYVEGEESDDRWRMVVEDNVLRTEGAIITWPTTVAGEPGEEG